MTDRVFVDTNVFIATLTDERERGDVATRFLDADFEFHTGLLNLMELRSALTKKKRIEQSRVEGVLSDVYGNVEGSYTTSRTCSLPTASSKRRFCTPWTLSFWPPRRARIYR